MSSTMKSWQATLGYNLAMVGYRRSSDKWLNMLLPDNVTMETLRNQRDEIVWQYTESR